MSEPTMPVPGSTQTTLEACDPVEMVTFLRNIITCLTLRMPGARLDISASDLVRAEGHLFHMLVWPAEDPNFIERIEIKAEKDV